MERFKTDVDLTRRQKQILSELCDGKTYKEIGGTLDISPRTVRYHVEELMHHFMWKQVSASCKSPESAKIKEIIHQRSRYGCFFMGECEKS